MRSISSVALALALAASVSLGATAQDAPKILRIRPLSGDALSGGEATAVQNLVTSYVVEFKAFRVIDAEGQELALKEAETAVQLGVPKDIAPLAADYILSANATKAGGLIVFTMDLTKVSSGEKRSVAETSPSVNELILALRRLTRSLFGQKEQAVAAAPQPAAPGAAAGQQGAAQATPPSAQQAGAAQGPAPAAEAQQQAFIPSPTLDMVAGSWSGDKGVDRVSIFKDGRGIAVLSTGKTLRIKASISGSTVVVVQDQPSFPELYRSNGVDLKAAREIAAKARPWRWVFSLAEGKNELSGTKESVFVKMDAAGKVVVDNNYVRDARWTRLFR